ncbi:MULTISPECIES: DNA (cytosine-5-)-methyltransferase [Actinosynnema]|uniref:DNA cytosine methyltransferase n=1 Tax=Actinosynnema TaxID=40566 RepID=UPI0020A5E27E|nr:DNA (cytosine-5-)-methyltransferase [Actinosynnema pretiosum]MCP2096761.1 DNA (cytosine-5)-methyltransferase 1 [Actinosynnema pretiosum]
MVRTVPKPSPEEQPSLMRIGPAAAEFFAGIGLARLGLEKAGFRVSWSNDIEPAKEQMYQRNFDDAPGEHQFALKDINEVNGEHLPERMDLAWASSPCVDVSLAGARQGLEGARSSTFFQFTRILGELPEESRPRVMTLENVIGLATSNNGLDLAAAISALNDLGYSADVITLDARWFVPQSRPRLFVVGLLGEPEGVLDENADEPNPMLRPPWLQRVPKTYLGKPLRTHRFKLPDITPPKNLSLSTVVDPADSEEVLWWDEARVDSFKAQLSPIQEKRLAALLAGKKTVHRTAYRRTRQGKPQWEIRPDDIAGCLRTARGGSSKQALVEAGNGLLRIRWMTSNEYARLMGADGYQLQGIKPNQALFGFGDAVCVPAVAWLAQHYLRPFAKSDRPSQRASAARQKSAAPNPLV